MESIFNTVVQFMFPALAVNILVDLLFKRILPFLAWPNIMRLFVVVFPALVAFAIAYFDQWTYAQAITDASKVSVISIMFYESKAYPKIRDILINKLGGKK